MLKNYLLLLFAVFPAFDAFPFFEATYDCHPCIRDSYFSTLLQADKRLLCNICEIGANGDFIGFTATETIFSGRYPVISVFGAKPVIPYVTLPWVVWDASTVSGSTVFGTTQTIRGLPNPLVMDLLVRWKSDMKDFWARSRLATWQEQ